MPNTNPPAAIGYPRQEVSAVTNDLLSHPIPRPRNTSPGVIPHQGSISSVNHDSQQQRQLGRIPRTNAPPAGPENISFNSIGGNMTQFNVTSHGESGIAMLLRHVVPEALHDSGERFPEPACHPGTRTAVLEQLRSWCMEPRPQRPILWLHGAAGAGKSAIAQMFAGNCHTMGRLGASFFFKRGHPKRGTWNGLVTTIAYQLSMAIPALLFPLQQAVDLDPLLLGRAMPLQFERLFVQLFTNPAARQFTPVIIVDGLDECADHSVQQQILRLFIGAILEHSLPIRLLICSRPEPHLREIIETAETSTIFHQRALSADPAAFDDIRRFLRNQFTRIGADYRVRGIDLGVRWPGPDTLEHLVAKSSGIFIYAATVIRFIDDEYFHPQDRLELVLRLDPQSTAPLDDLYSEIISVVPYEPRTIRILHAVWRSTARGPQLDPEEIDILVGCRTGTSRLILRGLHSLVKVPPFGDRVRGRQTYLAALHASLLDYLCDPRRSRRWCISTPGLDADYLESMNRLLWSPLDDFCQSLYTYRIVSVLPPCR
ncbi:hypothetical protein B0H19DRAFT_530292 [Mycena capillaripes]|nr:hypothetical protein B0H19DRAFT_530292 [Mycena capillaripes]